ncbi:MAG: NAD(P)-dependent oxidoreductase [Acidimicrobiia bacterium]|nr:NAD(P)-dependent oxidoreductase [Acidimicrobiia bacterium]
MTAHGYIGLGAMGAAMCRHQLDQGLELVVHDIDAHAVAGLVEQGARAAASAAEVAEACDLIEICVPAAAHIEAVVDGPGGIAETARPGTTLLIHSTVHPDTMRSVADRAGAWHGASHDVCVGGGTVNAEQGTLVLFVGGLADLSPAARELLDVVGSDVIDAGSVGAGAAVKIGFNVMTYSQFAAARTALALVEAHGAAPDDLVEAWRHAGQLGALTERALPLFSMTPDVVEQFGMTDDMRTNVDIARKDLDLAQQVGRAGGPTDGYLAALSQLMATVYSVEDTEDE